jgi:hypothetical protein
MSRELMGTTAADLPGKAGSPGRLVGQKFTSTTAAGPLRMLDRGAGR